MLISCCHRYTVLLCVDLQRIADSILYADILVRESMTVLFTNPRQNMWHSQVMQPAQHTRSVRMVFGCSAFSQCIIPWPEFPAMHAIIERVCLGIPKRCIVGNSLTCPSGLWACQRVYIESHMLFWLTWNSPLKPIQKKDTELKSYCTSCYR